ncbi:phosphoribosyltransferase [Zoogloea sp.]|uniref:phosphoribosyltransferase n=1 Tax=Zoogloea sp. TaxID=49181 RepID=UPI002616B814|nr:phosphoribosyltransferase family protein [uncultured Zoogloea sp.]
MIFSDRLDAGRRLADALAGYRGGRPLVLAIPRGGVPVAAVVAEALEGDLDVVLVHKLCSRWAPEYAVGAIDETGYSFVLDASEEDDAWLKDEKIRRLAELRRRRALYSPPGSAADPGGRVVMVVDDGLATGATMQAALHSVRAQGPARLICAVPVAAPASLARIRGDVDELVCLSAPAGFEAVGQFYLEFGQVEDEDVVACLLGYRDRLRGSAEKA